jgi:hypothetical protein
MSPEPCGQQRGATYRSLNEERVGGGQMPRSPVACQRGGLLSQQTEECPLAKIERPLLAQLGKDHVDHIVDYRAVLVGCSGAEKSGINRRLSDCAAIAVDGRDEQRGDVQFVREQPGDPQQAGDIIDVGIDAARDARILDLDGDLPAIK